MEHSCKTMEKNLLKFATNFKKVLSKFRQNKQFRLKNYKYNGGVPIQKISGSKLSICYRNIKIQLLFVKKSIIVYADLHHNI